jgi:arylsulfatase A-like enzyme
MRLTTTGLRLAAVLATATGAAAGAAEPLEPMAAFAPGSRILFQGDSITDGNRGRSPDPNHILGHGYAFIVAAKHGAGHADRGLVFLNRGVSGNTVRELEKRWTADTIDLKPDLLSVLVGVNDLGRGVPIDEYEQTYDRLLATAREANPKLKLVLGDPFGQSADASAPPPPRPNIVYVICDDLGYGDVQCLNPDRGKIPTPCIDRLASQGMTFTDAHGGSSVCTPTRYGILTGRYCWRTRLQAGVLDGGDAPPLIAEGRLTVPELLRRAGYRTAAVGKWHLGFTSERDAGPAGDAKDARPKGKGKGGAGGLPAGARILGGPTMRGFDTFFGFSNARTMAALIEDDRVAERIEPVEMLPRLTGRVRATLAGLATGGKPFFLYWALNSPHTPIVPSAAWKGKSPLGAYGDFVMQTDAAVGEALAAIDAAGLADSTLVVFTSDNGCSPAAGTPGLEKQGHFASGPYRGYKADLWDGGHRIPFLVRWPGVVRPGSSCRQLVCLTDLMATCADLLGTPLPVDAGEDSVSLLPLLKGEDRPVREAAVHHSIHGAFAIRQGPWKLELCPGSGGWGKPGDAEARKQGLPAVQLYDLAADPGERNNVQSEHPDVVARMTALLERYVAEGRSTPGAPQRNDTTVEIRKAPGRGGSEVSPEEVK